MRKKDVGEHDMTYDAAHLGLVFVRAANAVVKQGEFELQGLGLSSTDFRVLEVLLHKGPLPVNTIGPKVALTAGAISVAIDRLVGRGLVQRHEGERDKRVRTVTLTDEGRKVIVPAFRTHAAFLRRVFEALTPEERNALEILAKKVGRHVENMSASDEMRGYDSADALNRAANGHH